MLVENAVCRIGIHSFTTDTHMFGLLIRHFNGAICYLDNQIGFVKKKVVNVDGL